MSRINQLIYQNPLVGRLLSWKQGDEEDSWRNKAYETLKKKLKKGNAEDYKLLELALAKKTQDTPCIPIQRSQDGRLQVSHRKMLPQVIYCRIFRWPDLQSHHELRSTNSCQYPTSRREPKICVNPYHYERIYHPALPPVVTPRNDREFTNASPPQSPLSPSSIYSQQLGSPQNYMQHLPQPAHEHNNQYAPMPAHKQYKQENPFDQSNFRQQANSQLALGYPGQSPTSENYYLGNGSQTESMSSQIESPNGHQAFDSQTPPPRYSGRVDLCLQNGMMPMDAMDDTHQSSQSYSGQPKNEAKPWCRITYAELNQKIGEPFKSSSSEVYVDGFTDPSVTNHRFSLGVLSNINRNSTIEQTRCAIRKGICLENLGDQIFVENLSDSSIFFHSKNCNLENQFHHLSVVKIEPRRRHKIFDQKVFDGIVQEARMSEGNAYEKLFSLTDHCIIKMSFVKGWGSIYQRQDVTSTPCWIEICLLEPYALLDKYLQDTRPTHLNITSTS